MAKEEKNKILVLIDGHALVHRAYHALPPLNTNRGELVNAVYGFVSILLKVIKELQPDYLVAAFDLPKPTFRHEEFEAYKAKRVKAPDELYAQIGRVKEVLAAFNVPVFEKEGYEADDIIGTIARQVKNKKIKTIIATGDLDTLQLVNKNTSIFTLKKGVKDTIMYDDEAVIERYGLKPEQMNDFKGLKGDPSDNIPGVPGVGEKTAVELLQEFGSIEQMYRFLEEETPKLKIKNARPASLGEAGEKLKNKIRNLKPKLLEAKEQAFFSKYLATIKTDVPLKFKLAEALAHDYDKEKVVKLFKELGFYSLIDRLAQADSSAAGKSEESEKIAGADAVHEKIEEAYRQGVLSPKIYELEKALVPLIKEMEKNGIKIDLNYLKKLGEKFGKQLAELEEKIYRAAGIKFNINSPQQLSEILFTRLGLITKGLKKTPGKVISTAASELEKMRGQHQIVDLIMEYRELAKLKNTYVDALPKLAASDGRLHTSFDQLGTVTGRLSSKNPNLQNIPIKTEIGREIRRAFVADKGCKLLAADYSQIELRIVATMAQDKEMILAFKEGKDIHTLTAAEVFGVAPEKVTSQMRRAAKALNFGVIYGMSMHGFAEAAGVDLMQAKDFIEKYFKEFSGVARYVEKTKKEAALKGYVQTLFGRQRFIPEINSSAWNLRAAAERMAINMPIQGCLPWSTKILTSEGYIPIGYFYGKRKKPKFVWTGFQWSKYKVLNRGKAQLAEIKFFNGQVFQCDVRHKVLAVEPGGYAWKNFSELKPGMKICFSFPRIHEFKKQRPIKFNYIPKVHNGVSFSVDKISSDFWYWIGYYYGDGYFTRRWNRSWNYYLFYYFGSAAKEKAKACIIFFRSLGLNPKKRLTAHKTKKGILSKRIQVTISSKGLGKFFEALQIETGKLAKTKRLSQLIFKESAENRRSFIKGLMDSDGCYGKSARYVPNLHLCQYHLLADVQLLLRSLGIESNLRGPFHSGNSQVSYRLDIPRRALFSLLNKKTAQFSRYNNKPTPRFLISELISLYPDLKRADFKKYSDYILYRRWTNKGTSSIYHFFELLQRNNLKMESPIYIWHEIKKIRRLEKKETTYTLSINEGSHRFDSEGVISKNTAADLIKMAMVEIAKSLELIANSKSHKPYAISPKLLLQVHDELIFEVPQDKIEEVAGEIKQIMENVYQLAVPLKVEIEAGDNWGQMEVVNL